MKRYNVYFDFDSEVEIGVIVETTLDYETQRESIVEEAKSKLKLKGFNVEKLENTDVNFLEEI
jgi:hypothetical protein